MKPSRIASLLEVFIPARKPMLIIGRPGASKTSVVKQATEKLDYDLVTWHPITSDPVDFKGFPVTSTDKKGKVSADFVPYGDLEAVINPQRPTVCLIDDLGQAAPAVQSAVMHPLLAREINGHKISDLVSFVACSNRREDRAGVTGFNSALLDRMVARYVLEPDVDDWITWAFQNDVAPAVIAFIKLRPDYITTWTATRDIVKQPTPRSIFEMSEMIKLGVDDVEAIEGMVGDAMATEFAAFYSTFGDLPDIDEIIMSPKKAPLPDATRPDVAFALSGSLAHHATVDNFDSIVTYLERMPPEFGVMCVKTAIELDRKLMTTGAYTRFTVKNQAMFGLAGD